MAGFAGVVIAMYPILSDGLRPVGRAWPAGQKPGFGRQSKGKFLTAALSAAIGLQTLPGSGEPPEPDEKGLSSRV
jgi:hypothetical protein